MHLVRRRKGSQRPRQSVDIIFHPNFTGQGGFDQLVLESEAEYFTITFSSLDEVRELLSQAHIVHHNYGT